MHEKTWEAGALRLVALSVLLFDDERPDVVPGLLVVFGVGSVAVRELQGDSTRQSRQKSLLSKFQPFVLYDRSERG